MKKVVTLGEIMLRLSAPNFQKIVQAQSFDAVYGGGEANVAVSLAKFGLQSSFVTKLPENAVGTSAEQQLNRFGVDTSHVLHGGDRLGIYFFEKGYSIRSSKVYYDRKHSAFAESKAEEYDFDAIFEGADWFHISGITPALSDELFLVTKEALSAAKKKGLTTSCDLNYRSALWPFDEARKKMTELIKDVDVCIGIEPLSLPDEDGEDIKERLPENPSTEDYKGIMDELCKRFGFKHVVMTKREHVSVNRNRLYALLYDGKEIYQSREVEVDIIDRVGTGDAFSAGIIYALISEYKPQDAVEFATGCFALKHTIEGDANLIPIADVERYMARSFAIDR
ncbi:carbohydrate kinase [Bacillus sp. FJAT-27225]|uniref:sugar kinase n=1 Tax=Bacillus sp. FJAT-27225 TaxID=1743144 RepID=UPI00080C2C1F|nr:sugar kinase [Bacillus sp. FJAT-27225]OCA83242.1 carbohydrate kinase [Bacillus sp. FJAT-27225]